jgi:hypothetical protein
MEKRTDFALVRTAVIEEGGKRFVEIDFSADPKSDQPSRYIRARAEISSSGHLIDAEAHLEALRILRNAIGDETQRLSQIVDQGCGRAPGN